MARIKRRRNARSHQRMKRRTRNPNIPELVYKFLVQESEAARDASRIPAARCRCCDHERYHDQVVDSARTRSTGKAMGYRVRGDAGKVSKSRRRPNKRRPTSRDSTFSYLQKCVGAEDTRRARKYIKKALNFGVESGYLIPSDPTYKILRVASELMKNDSQKSKPGTCDKDLSKERETPTKLEDLQVQEQRRRGRRRRRTRRSRSRRSGSPPRRRRRSSRRRRRRRRSRRGGRSRSRSRGGRTRYSSPQSPEEVAEDEADDYELEEDDPKSGVHTDGIDREPKTKRAKQSDEEQPKKTEENDSDLSVDEDESDDEEGKKRVDIVES